MQFSWSGLWSFFGWGPARRVPGIQVIEPGTGRLTTRSVTPETAMQLSAVFACVRLLSETIASLPLRFYEKKAGGVLKEIESHPLQNLLETKPNRYQTNVEFKETLVSQLALHGNSYNRIERAGGSKKEIISLLPYMSPQVGVEIQDNGDLMYQYNNGRGVGIFHEQSIWHNKLFGNGVIGYSPLDYARNSIGIAISADDRVSKMANNSFKPSGILMIDKVLNPEQRKKIRENFGDLTEGGEDALRVLEAGMTYTTISMNPKDVQLLETRRFHIEDIARFFNVPSVLINDLSATTVWGSGIQQIVTGFYKLSLRPYLERIESSILVRLLPIEERGKIVPSFDFDKLLQEGEKTRYEAYKTAIQGGVKTPNECRKEEGLEPKAGGDDLLVQQQMIPLGRKDNKTGGIPNEQAKTT